MLIFPVQKYMDNIGCSTWLNGCLFLYYDYTLIIASALLFLLTSLLVAEILYLEIRKINTKLKKQSKQLIGVMYKIIGDLVKKFVKIKLWKIFWTVLFIFSQMLIIFSILLFFILPFWSNYVDMIYYSTKDFQVLALENLDLNNTHSVFNIAVKNNSTHDRAISGIVIGCNGQDKNFYCETNLPHVINSNTYERFRCYVDINMSNILESCSSVIVYEFDKYKYPTQLSGTAVNGN